MKGMHTIHAPAPTSVGPTSKRNEVPVLKAKTYQIFHLEYGNKLKRRAQIGANSNCISRAESYKPVFAAALSISFAESA